jgi:hypothetical protein
MTSRGFDLTYRVADVAITLLIIKKAKEIIQTRHNNSNQAAEALKYFLPIIPSKKVFWLN